MRAGASSAVMSIWNAVPPIRFATSARAAPCAGTSRTTRFAPSRASFLRRRADEPVEGALRGRRLRVGAFGRRAEDEQSTRRTEGAERRSQEFVKLGQGGYLVDR